MAWLWISSNYKKIWMIKVELGKVDCSIKIAYFKTKTLIKRTPKLNNYPWSGHEQPRWFLLWLYRNIIRKIWGYWGFTTLQIIRSPKKKGTPLNGNPSFIMKMENPIQILATNDFWQAIQFRHNITTFQHHYGGWSTR